MMYSTPDAEAAERVYTGARMYRGCRCVLEMGEHLPPLVTDDVVNASTDGALASKFMEARCPMAVLNAPSVVGRYMTQAYTVNVLEGCSGCSDVHFSGSGRMWGELLSMLEVRVVVNCPWDTGDGVDAQQAYSGTPHCCSDTFVGMVMSDTMVSGSVGLPVAGGLGVGSCMGVDVQSCAKGRMNSAPNGKGVDGSYPLSSDVDAVPEDDLVGMACSHGQALSEWTCLNHAADFVVETVHRGWETSMGMDRMSMNVVVYSSLLVASVFMMIAAAVVGGMSMSKFREYDFVDLRCRKGTWDAPMNDPASVVVDVWPWAWVPKSSESKGVSCGNGWAAQTDNRLDGLPAALGDALQPLGMSQVQGVGGPAACVVVVGDGMEMAASGGDGKEMNVAVHAQSQFFAEVGVAVMGCANCAEGCQLMVHSPVGVVQESCAWCPVGTGGAKMENSADVYAIADESVLGVCSASCHMVNAMTGLADVEDVEACAAGMYVQVSCSEPVDGVGVSFASDTVEGVAAESVGIVLAVYAMGVGMSAALGVVMSFEAVVGAMAWMAVGGAAWMMDVVVSVVVSGVCLVSRSDVVQIVMREQHSNRAPMNGTAAWCRNDRWLEQMVSHGSNLCGEGHACAHFHTKMNVSNGSNAALMGVTGGKALCEHGYAIALNGMFDSNDQDEAQSELCCSLPNQLTAPCMVTVAANSVSGGGVVTSGGPRDDNRKDSMVEEWVLPVLVMMDRSSVCGGMMVVDHQNLVMLTPVWHCCMRADGEVADFIAMGHSGGRQTALPELVIEVGEEAWLSGTQMMYSYVGGTDHVEASTHMNVSMMVEWWVAECYSVYKRGALVCVVLMLANGMGWSAAEDCSCVVGVPVGMAEAKEGVWSDSVLALLLLAEVDALEEGWVVRPDLDVVDDSASGVNRDGMVDNSAHVSPDWGWLYEMGMCHSYGMHNLSLMTLLGDWWLCVACVVCGDGFVWMRSAPCEDLELLIPDGGNMSCSKMDALSTLNVMVGVPHLPEIRLMCMVPTATDLRRGGGMLTSDKTEVNGSAWWCMGDDPMKLTRVGGIVGSSMGGAMCSNGVVRDGAMIGPIGVLEAPLPMMMNDPFAVPPGLHKNKNAEGGMEASGETSSHDCAAVGVECDWTERHSTNKRSGAVMGGVRDRWCVMAMGVGMAVVVWVGSLVSDVVPIGMSVSVDMVSVPYADMVGTAMDVSVSLVGVVSVSFEVGVSMALPVGRFAGRMSVMVGVTMGTDLVWRMAVSMLMPYGMSCSARMVGVSCSEATLDGMAPPPWQGGLCPL